MEVPLKRFKIELPYDPATPLLTIHPKEIKSLCQGDLHLQIIIIHDNWDTESTQVSINR